LGCLNNYESIYIYMNKNTHPTALVHKTAKVHKTAQIGPYCVVGAGVEIGAGTILISHVVVEGPTTLGAQNIVHPFAVLGGAPQDVKYKGAPTKLVVGDGNIIREYVSLHRGTEKGLGITTVGDGNFFMAASHVGHDCSVGNHCTFANSALLAGHVQVADFANIGGNAAVHQFCRIGTRAMVGGGSIVVRDVVPYSMVYGNHAQVVGLNLVGLKRMGMAKNALTLLQKQFDILCTGKGTLAARVAALQKQKKISAELRVILNFITTSTRGVCAAAQGQGYDG
jgi:UDP-N-acetylglucosamine acyltransferase